MMQPSTQLYQSKLQELPWSPAFPHPPSSTPQPINQSYWLSPTSAPDVSLSIPTLVGATVLSSGPTTQCFLFWPPMSPLSTQQHRDSTFQVRLCLSEHWPLASSTALQEESQPLSTAFRALHASSHSRTHSPQPPRSLFQLPRPPCCSSNGHTCPLSLLSPLPGTLFPHIFLNLLIQVSAQGHLLQAGLP